MLVREALRAWIESTVATFNCRKDKAFMKCILINCILIKIIFNNNIHVGNFTIRSTY